MNDAAIVARNLRLVREKGPLVHNITNYVVMNTTANALLAVGASPIMAHAIEEIGDLIGIADALVLNIGTLSASWVASMRKAGEAARIRALPTVLDPVGVGASRMRTETALALLDAARPAVVRGNPSEILALARAAGCSEERAGTKGVDSVHTADAARSAAQALAKRHACTVVVSGPTDLVTDGESTVFLTGGSPLMPRVTGMGCTASALVGAFATVAESPLEAAVSAMAVMSGAGEIAALHAGGPGSFQVHFLDALYTLAETDLARSLHLTREES